MPLDDGSIDWVSSNHFSPEASFFFGVLVLGFGGAGLVFLLFHRAKALRERQAAEERAFGSPSELTPGPNKLVRGTVDAEGGEAIAVRVEVFQKVKNHTSKNNSWHTWEEIHRKTQSRPFYLLRDGGEPVMVEPGDDVFVIDDMQTTYRDQGHERRCRYCDVESGETFSAYGTLVRAPHPRAASGYRDGTGWVLRPPANGRTYLASGAIKDRYPNRIQHLQRWGVGALLAFVAFHALATVPYLVASFAGEREEAQIVSHRTWITTNKNSRTTHYGLTARTASGYTFEREVPSSTYDLGIRYEGLGTRVPSVHFSDWSWAAYLGDRPTMNGIAIIVGIVGSAIAAGAFAASYGAKHAWYDRKKLSEHGGSGHYTGPPSE